LLNQHSNLNKGKKALLNPEVIIVHDLFLTPTARFADIVIPVNHYLERNDIGQAWIGGPYSIFMNKALDAPPGLRSDLAVFTEIARLLGINDYNNRSDEQWLKAFLEAEPDLPDLETFRASGFHHFESDSPYIPFRKQIEDPDRHPFPTPSGKIEIFSRKFAELNNPLIPPVPKYLSEGGDSSSQLEQNYPIQLISPHSRARVNSQFDNIERLKKLGDDDLWMNTDDASIRGIKNGDMVSVFNQRGRIRTRAKVTPDIKPGVASLDQGQWYHPDEQGADPGSCINVLTEDKKTPAGAFPFNTCLVQIEKP
jgi:anaerobic dimethyl sulfoxide reductase subunit A